VLAELQSLTETILSSDHLLRRLAVKVVTTPAEIHHQLAVLVVAVDLTITAQLERQIKVEQVVILKAAAVELVLPDLMDQLAEMVETA
jgi:hypothetical protein